MGGFGPLLGKQGSVTMFMRLIDWIIGINPMWAYRDGYNGGCGSSF
jgi:hypothetical protein